LDELLKKQDIEFKRKLVFLVLHQGLEQDLRLFSMVDNKVVQVLEREYKRQLVLLRTWFYPSHVENVPFYHILTLHA